MPDNMLYILCYLCLQLEGVNVIHLASVSCKLSKSDEVLAVYPDTTSFYRAVITQPPRRNVQSQGSASVQFAVSSSSTIATHHYINTAYVFV
jgi:SGF29 tudor-like domain